MIIRYRVGKVLRQIAQGVVMSKLAVIVLMALSLAPLAAAVEFKTFGKEQYSQTVTDCDRVAAHPMIL